MLNLRSFSHFLADKRGSILPLFALAVIPIIGSVGAAIDYSRGNSVKAAMQAALDSTGLMLSKEANSLTPTQVTQKANDYFAALFNRPDAHGITLTPTLKDLQNGRYQLDISSYGFVDTTFLRVIGQSDMKVSVSTQIVWGYKKLELALALDNTGSMSSSGKMTALKQASHSLISIMKKAAKNPGDIKISIIPFDTTVKVGTGFKNASWIDWTNWEANNGKWEETGSGWNKKWVWKPDSHNKWEGCVRDRSQSNDALDTAPVSGNTATLFPAFDCGSLAPAMPLTYDWTALDKRIDDMTPNGNTNVTLGLAWAWHSLTSNQPFAEGAAPSSDLDKVVLILTDGDNTEAWNNSTQNKITKQSTIDARTAAACDNIKAAGIKIYSVRVIDGNASLLKSCATNPSMYFDVRKASDLDAVFTSIAESLANLRIAK